MSDLGKWLDKPATIADVILIAFLAACLVSMFVGLGAENSAKKYAEELFRRLK